MDINKEETIVGGSPKISIVVYMESVDIIVAQAISFCDVILLISISPYHNKSLSGCCKNLGSVW